MIKIKVIIDRKTKEVVFKYSVIETDDISIRPVERLSFEQWQKLKIETDKKIASSHRF